MSNTNENLSRILIHAGSSGDDHGRHPEWRGDNNVELKDCAFAIEEENLDAHQTMTEINSRLETVLDKAPSDATANLLLRKSRDGGYRAFLRVRSAHRKFGGFIRGKSLLDTVDKVLSQVKTQIDDWKQKRFVEET